MIDSRTNVCYYIYEAYPQGAIIVTMAVRFFAESYSSDYIETLWESDGKEICLCLQFQTLSQFFRCVLHFMVLDTCMGSTIPRQKNNRPVWSKLVRLS